MAKERKCLCCGKAYEYCPNCGKSSEPWKIDFDSESCRDLFNVISGYNMGISNKENVNFVIDKYSITDYTIYKDSIRNKLESILSKKDEKRSQSEVLIVEEDKSEVSENNSIEENPVLVAEYNEVQPRRRRNRFFE